MHWAFTTFEVAEAFLVKFGGRLIDAGDENPKSLRMRARSARRMSEILEERGA